MIRLVVKGPPEVALAAAKQRGIEVTVIRLRGSETVLGAPEASWRAVAAWMGEPPRTTPFPPGALLYFKDDLTPTLHNDRGPIDPDLQGRP